MPGRRITWFRPAAPSAVNHSSITGPKTRPTRSVPWRWMANNPVRTAAEIGTTALARCGATTPRAEQPPVDENAVENGEVAAGLHESHEGISHGLQHGEARARGHAEEQSVGGLPLPAQQ